MCYEASRNPLFTRCYDLSSEIVQNVEKETAQALKRVSPVDRRYLSYCHYLSIAHLESRELAQIVHRVQMMGGTHVILESTVVCEGLSTCDVVRAETKREATIVTGSSFRLKFAITLHWLPRGNITKTTIP